MQDGVLHKISLMVESRLTGQCWKLQHRQAKYLSFRAADTDQHTLHDLIVIDPYGIVESGEGSWLALNVGVGILYERLEAIIDRVLNRQKSNNRSVTINLSSVVRPEKLYLGSLYLVDIASEDQMLKSVDGLLYLYNQKLEPLRKRLRTESCFDDAFFYPQDDYSILGWELRRAAHYSITLRPDDFSRYLEALNGRVDAYEFGLGDDTSLAAQTARKMIADLRGFVRNVHAS